MGVYSVQGTPKYCYPGTTVLINRLGLTDQAELDRVERQIVLLKSTIAERELPFAAVDFLYYLDRFSHIIRYKRSVRYNTASKS